MSSTETEREGESKREKEESVSACERRREREVIRLASSELFGKLLLQLTSFVIPTILKSDFPKVKKIKNIIFTTN